MKNNVFISFLSSAAGILLLVLFLYVQYPETTDFERTLKWFFILYFVWLLIGMHFLVGWILQKDKIRNFLLNKINLVLSLVIVVLLFIIPFDSKAMLNDFLFGIVQALLFWFVLSLDIFLVSVIGNIKNKR